MSRRRPRLPAVRPQPGESRDHALGVHRYAELLSAVVLAEVDPRPWRFRRLLERERKWSALPESIRVAVKREIGGQP